MSRIIHNDSKVNLNVPIKHFNGKIAIQYVSDTGETPYYGNIHNVIFGQISANIYMLLVPDPTLNAKSMFNRVDEQTYHGVNQSIMDVINSIDPHYVVYVTM